MLAKLPDAFARQSRFRGTKRRARGESAFERSGDGVELDFGIIILREDDLRTGSSTSLPTRAT
jgi:hypothetical protein